jgi:hypothetical protein
MWERMMAAVLETEQAEQAAQHAPYKILRRAGKYVVVNNIGETKATFATRAEALKYQRALYVSVPGAAKRAARVHWTGKEPKPKE